MVNLVANRVARVIGLAEANERFLTVALFQGNERPNAVKAARMGDNESRLPARWGLFECGIRRKLSCLSMMLHPSGYVEQELELRHAAGCRMYLCADTTIDCLHD